MSALEDDMAEIAALNEREDKAIAAAVAARRQSENTEKAMARYMADALDCARLFALDHAQRAERRRLPASEAAFTSAAWIFDLLAETARRSGIRPSILWCAMRAFRAAWAASELERGGRYPDAWLHQSLECSTSEIHDLLWAVSNIEDFHLMMTEGSLAPHEAHIAAAEALMFLPSTPQPEQEITP